MRGTTRRAARAWTLMWERPRSWPQAMVQAVVLGVALGGLQLGLQGFDADRHWLLVWWMPLWLAVSATSYAFWSWRDRRRAVLQEPVRRR